MANKEAETTNFIRKIIDEDIAKGWNDGRVHTRFPPEPNGYLHIGHAKAIFLNYSIAKDYNGLFNVRFDDTNPLKEEQEYVDAILNDIKWLGVDWGDRLFFAADYFDRMYEMAVQLIKKGKAYVDDLSADEIREYRGTLTEPGRESPYRNRSVEENLDLFERMKNGEFPDGSRVLRAKIDMASPNINMRDPVLYRIRHASHHRSGDKWCIYPMYDFAHPLEDAFENITHSLCSIEYADHNELYEWVLDNVDYSGPGITGRPKQIEFARLNLTHTVMSKRKLRRLVEEGIVNGWDDPRLPTIAGLRRRGYTPKAIETFCDRIGVARSDSIVDIAFLEHCIREDLNATANRLMVVLRPLKITLENYPEDQVEWVTIENNPENLEAGERQVPFCRELYIEREDFMEAPPRKFYRLAPGREMRLKGAYIIKCERVIKDEDGNIVELICSYDPESKSGMPGADRRVKATAHWVSAKHAIPITARLYDHLFLKADPDDAPEGQDFMANINPNSLVELTNCMAEPAIKEAKPEDRFQFLRQGYFYIDPVDSKDGKIVANRIVDLRDTWKRKKK
ncbi:MAG: glutamine--tRNA ligase/YqeY domain fusion protein [Firmicutes bacterium]|nr:glutamine--tRNA ligase/YqeY domain fusion protein [Bacillota bacterium]